jgi:hypothetical protein
LVNDAARALPAKARESLASARADLEPPVRDDVATTVRNAEAFVGAIAALIEQHES